MKTREPPYTVVYIIIHIYICIYIYISIYIYLCSDVCIYIYYTYIHTGVCSCVSVCVCVYKKNIYMYTYIFVYAAASGQCCGQLLLSVHSGIIHRGEHAVYRPTWCSKGIVIGVKLDYSIPPPSKNQDLF